MADESIPKGCVIVGWQLRYDGWPTDRWEFRYHHPGELPKGHATRIVRPVYARFSDEITQTPKPYSYPV